MFVYDGGGQLVAEYSTQLAETPQVSYLTSDHLGSPRVITNQLGAVTTRKDYMAFGEETYTTQRTSAINYDNQSETRKGYTGYEKDDESGLDFAQARYYNSKHGRYTSVDPLTASANVKNPQTFNRYSYVLNSPYKFTDPLGLISSSTGACGTGCRNSGGFVDGSAFRGNDTTLNKIFDDMQAQRQATATAADRNAGAAAQPSASGVFRLPETDPERIKLLNAIENSKGDREKAIATAKLDFYDTRDSDAQKALQAQAAPFDPTLINVVIAGHGGINEADGYTTVQDNLTVTFYSPVGYSLDDKLGNEIDQIGGQKGKPNDLQSITVGGGASIRDMIIFPSSYTDSQISLDPITIGRKAITVTEPTKLSTLLARISAENKGKVVNVHISVCLSRTNYVIGGRKP